LFELTAEVVNALGVKAVQSLVFLAGGICITYINTNNFNMYPIVLNTIILFFIFIFVIGLHKDDKDKSIDAKKK